MPDPRITAQVVTWNSAGVIADLLHSLKRQSVQPQVVVVDNASHDDTVQIVREVMPEARVLQQQENLGFSGGHNVAMHATATPFTALVNPDLVLAPTALELLLSDLERMEDVGSIGGKLLKNEGESGTIDATGMTATRRRQFLNRGEGERDHGQYDRSGEVFGLSGAFVILRRRALESIRFEQEFLDEDFFAYKEDVDLAWSLRTAGWRNWYEPRAVAYHSRRVRHTTTEGAEEGSRDTARRRQQKSAWVNSTSYRNHLLLLMKHERWPFLPLPTLSYELKKFAYVLLRERSSLPALGEALRLLPRMRAKARALEHVRTTPRSALERWFL